MDCKKLCHDIYYASDVCDKEPKAGCRVVLKGDAWWERGVMIRNDKIDNVTTGKICERDDDWEIIGHPPTLASWLHLISKLKNTYTVRSDYDTLQIRDFNDFLVCRLNLKTEEPTDWEALYNIIK